jgi:hypothetical protein
MILYGDLLLRVHLPGLVGDGRAGRVGLRPAPPRGRGQARPGEPALEGSLRGDGPSGLCLEQVDTDQARAPGGVFAAQPQGRPDRFGEAGLVGRGAGIVGWDPLGAVLTKPRDQPTNGRARHP